MRPTRIGRVRAIVLILVHVAMVGHLLHWQLNGRTLGPLVLSEGMRTLELGEVSPGALLFAAALLVTLVCGRFLCGWLCHMGALQDFCAWLLRKCGVKPRLFRARLLGYVPLGLGFYMFVWPTLERLVVTPLVESRSAAAFPGFSNSLLTEELWAGLPGPLVTVAFLLVCGGATVYFLGSRGLCRYGCPYGGLFEPIERLAPARIVVDREACDGCGICTAACCSGIRVHEEVQAYGRVVSGTCMKTLDCVSACPSSALRMAFTRPGIAKGIPAGPPPPARHDLTWPQELWVLGVFLAVLLTVRGLYGTFPLLMAAGIAICAAFVAWKLWRLVRDRDVRLGAVQLRRDGRLRPAGATFGAFGVLLAVLFAQSVFVRVVHWQGGRLDNSVKVAREHVFSVQRPALEPAAAVAAESALRLYTLGSGWSDGGWGLANTHAVDIRAAWLSLVLGDHPRAEALLARGIERGGRSDGLSADLARIALLRGEPERAATYLTGVVAVAPGMLRSLDVLIALHREAGRFDLIEALLRTEIERTPAPPLGVRLQLARLLLATARSAEAFELLEQAAEGAADPRVLAELAFALAANGRVPEAVARLETAASGAQGPAAEQYRQWADQIRRAPAATTH